MPPGELHASWCGEPDGHRRVSPGPIKVVIAVALTAIDLSAKAAHLTSSA